MDIILLKFLCICDISTIAPVVFMHLVPESWAQFLRKTFSPCPKLLKRLLQQETSDYLQENKHFSLLTHIWYVT